MSRQGISDDTIVGTAGGVDDNNKCTHDMSDITSTSIKQAAIKLQQANYLLITTGAGFSADSGLQTYECAPVEYRDMCNPFKLTEEPFKFQKRTFKIDLQATTVAQEKRLRPDDQDDKHRHRHPPPDSHYLKPLQARPSLLSQQL